MREIIFIAAILVLAACTPPKAKTARSDDRFFVISHAGAGDPFWNIVFNGVKQAAIDINLNVQILAPETPNDLARQIELFKSALATKPKGIAVSIADDRAFSEPLQEARKQGVPVIAFNTKPSDKALRDNPYLAYVGMDDLLAGKSLAERAIRTGLIKDRVMIAMHQAGHIGLEQRAVGIKGVLKPLNIEVDKLDISADATQAKQIVQGYLSKHKDCTAVFFAGAFGLHALARTIKEEHPTILLSSFDLTPLTVELIKLQKVSCTVDQQPFLQGYMALTQLSLYSRYAIQPSDMNTGVALIDAKSARNLDQLVSLGVR